MTREEAKKVLETEREWLKTIYEVSNLIVTAYKVSFIEAFDMAIEALQERPKGRWIEKDGNAYCSECNACWGLDKHFDLADHKASHKFCNVCGADMRESEQE